MTRKILQFYLLIMTLHASLFCIASPASSVYSPEYCVHRRGKTNNDLMPELRLVLTPNALTENLAVSFLGEAGYYNYRANGTVGYELNCNQRVKISGEYLRQRLAYNFSSGKQREWVDQGAIGGAYQYMFDCDWMCDLEVSGYYSYAPSHNLRSVLCPDQFLLVHRHIAGSEACGAEIAATIAPWCLGSFTIGADYDYVKYRRKFQSHHYVSGLGAVVELRQGLGYGFNVDALAEFRRPFNYYKVLLNWTTRLDCGYLGIGAFGSHTQGRRAQLPNNTVAGVEVTFSFNDPSQCCTSPVKSVYDSRCGGIYEYWCDNCCSDINPCLTAWVTDPAVYLPQVLAIPDQAVVSTCKPLIVVPIPNMTYGSGPYTINLAQFFASQNDLPIVFSARGLPAGATLDPATGLITGISPDDGSTSFITVTAFTRCAAASQLFTVHFTCTAPTSTTIDFAIETTGLPYAFSIAGQFVSPGGQPFTFSATGLPPGGSIDPVTGIISGIGPDLPQTFNVTVTGTTACGSTSITFPLIFMPPA